MPALISMTRPGNTLMASASVWLGGWVAGANLGIPALWIDGIALGLLAAAGNVHNDVVDLEIDKVNRPGRPLPSGKVNSLMALGFAGILSIIAVGMGFTRGTPQGLFMLGILALLFTYNRTLKGLPLLGNIAVALLCASALWLPSLEPSIWVAGANPLYLLPLILFSFLFNFVREMVKDVEDIEGDSKQNLRTMPILAGVKNARILILLMGSFAVLSPILPVIIGIYPPLFLVFCSLFVVFPTLIALIATLPHRNDWHRSQQMLKFAMIGGLFASAITLKQFPFI